MKKLMSISAVALATVVFLSGCVVAVGSGPKSATTKATVGQQLVDLQKARDSGAITPAEYEVQKAKVLEGK